MKNLLMASNTIAGMPIAASEVNLNGANENNNPSSGPNLALILGICIPVGVIGK